MAKAKKDTRVESLEEVAVEEGISPEFGDLDPRSSEEIAKDIDVALKEQGKPQPSDTEPESELRFKPADEEPPEEPASTPEKDTVEEKTAIERLKEKKGYKSEEEIAKAYEELEKLIGKREGDIQEPESPSPPEPSPVPPQEETFDPFWEKMARNPVQTLEESVEQVLEKKARRFQEQAREMTRHRLIFEDKAKGALPYWDNIQAEYNRNVQLGMHFGEAFERAELKYLRLNHKRGYAKGLEDTEIKTKEAEKAVIEGSVANVGPKKEEEVTEADVWNRDTSLEEIEKLLPHKYND